MLKNNEIILKDLSIYKKDTDISSSKSVSESHQFLNMEKETGNNHRKYCWKMEVAKVFTLCSLSDLSFQIPTVF